MALRWANVSVITGRVPEWARGKGSPDPFHFQCLDPFTSQLTNTLFELKPGMTNGGT